MSEKAYRVLIAEDEPRIAAFMAKGLRRSGFIPEVVTDGHDVLLTLAHQDFDLLLLDLGLPGKTGPEILAAMELQGLVLPTIVVTALPIEPGDEGGQVVFTHEVVRKPFLMKDLIQKIRDALAPAGDSLESV